MAALYSENRFCHLLLGTLFFFLSVRVAFTQSFSGVSGSQHGVYTHIQASQLKSTYGSPYYTTSQTGSGLCFIENKGQVHDQDYKPRPDVLFSGTDGRFVFHLKNKGVSYQLNRVNSFKSAGRFTGSHPASGRKVKKTEKLPDSSTIYRLDIDWPGANQNAFISKESMLNDHTNYYLAHCPEGITEVKSYRQIKYENIYQGIDLVWYEKNGELEYDYRIRPGGDYRQIKMSVRGADSLYITDKGDLVMVTPLGLLTEQAPVVTQKCKTLPARWVIQGQTIKYEIDNLDAGQPFVIDPVVRLWGTYYGGSNDFWVYTANVDKSGSIFMTGAAAIQSGMSLATSGSHQSNIGGNSGDALLVKFSSAGVRQWATFYGGSQPDYGMSCAADGSGFIYMSGESRSSTAIATPGSHKPGYSGGVFSGDAFLVKFDPNGVRQWGTYYGGSGDERGWTCSTDSSNNVYLAGTTGSSDGISSAGSHNDNFTGPYADAFLVKFNSAGVREWGTYYGDYGWDAVYSCVTDRTGNIYMAGETFTQFGQSIATAGSHQEFFGGGIYHGDAFVAKFNSNGVRQWGTYYGGLYDDYAGVSSSLSIDDSSNLFLAGETASHQEISTPGSHQEAHASLTSGVWDSFDAFLVKFNSDGIRQWATYYGDKDSDGGFSCSTDNNGNVFLSGTTFPVDTTAAGSVFATSGSYQTEYGGEGDAFIAKFSSSGVRLWGSYYGGPGGEDGRLCISDKKGVVYLSGLTTWTPSPDPITTPNGHQPVFTGGISDYNSFLVKLTENVFNQTISLCTSDLPFQWNGQMISAPGNYSAIVTTPQGFDSVLNLTLTVKNSSQSITSLDICSTQLPYSWNGILCDSAGAYTMVLTNAAGCDSITILNLTLSDPGFDAIRIFPNPASDYLNVVFQNNNSCVFPIIGELRIYNSIGQLVHYDKTNALTAPYDIRINISHLSAGIYFVRIGKFTGKIAIAR